VTFVSLMKINLGSIDWNLYSFILLVVSTSLFSHTSFSWPSLLYSYS
jgi:hypothetical protein